NPPQWRVAPTVRCTRSLSLPDRFRRPGERSRMTLTTLSLRVTAPGPAAARVSVGRRQFSIGRPVEFDDASPHVAAIEYALGAVGGEIVNGLREFARRR